MRSGTPMNKVVTRYPLSIRCGAVLVCVLFAVSIARGPVSTRTIVVAVAALSLSVALLTYKAEVDPAEIRVRYLPFYTKHTLMATSPISERKQLSFWSRRLRRYRYGGYP